MWDENQSSALAPQCTPYVYMLMHSISMLMHSIPFPSECTRLYTCRHLSALPIAPSALAHTPVQELVHSLLS